MWRPGGGPRLRGSAARAQGADRSRFSVLGSRFVFRFSSGFLVRGSLFGASRLWRSRFRVRVEKPALLSLAGVTGTATIRGSLFETGRIPAGMARAPLLDMGRGARRFYELRAWQACDVYKKAVYRLCLASPLSKDWKRRDQLENSVAGPPAHVAEGFGRFNPADFANFVTFARSSLMESQNHLRDAVDKNYITDETRRELETLAESALQEVTGLLDYLQSPEALRNARRARERRMASRQERLAKRPARAPKVRGAEQPNREPRTANPEPNLEHEPRTKNPEARTTPKRR
jgi:four helix bundle protein